MGKQIVTIKGQKFLVQSVLKLTNKYNILGFWETSTGWSKHVQSVELSITEWELIINAS